MADINNLSEEALLQLDEANKRAAAEAEELALRSELQRFNQANATEATTNLGEKLTQKFSPEDLKKATSSYIPVNPTADTERYGEKYLGTTATDLEEAQRREMHREYLKQKDIKEATERAGTVGRQLPAPNHDVSNLPQHRGGLPAKRVLVPEIIDEVAQQASHIKPDIEAVGREIKPSKLSSLLQLVKRNPKVAAALGVTGGAFLASQTGEQAKTSIPQPGVTPSSADLDRKAEELAYQDSEVPASVETENKRKQAFKDAIAEIESSSGKNVDHQRMESGIHKGDKAFGDIGLMPNTAKQYAKELLSSGDDSAELQGILSSKQGSDQVNQILEDNPELYQKLKDYHFDRLLIKNKNDPFKAAHAHYYGENFAQNRNLDGDKFNPFSHDKSGYIDKFKKAYETRGDNSGMAASLASRSGEGWAKDLPTEERQLASEEVNTSTPLDGESKQNKELSAALAASVSADSSNKLNELASYDRAHNSKLMTQLIADLGRAGNKIGASIAGGFQTPSMTPIKFDNTQFDEIAKRANQPIEDYAIRKQVRQEADLSDPNSPASVSARAMMASVFPNIAIPETASAAQLKSAGFDLSKVVGLQAGFEKQKRSQDFTKEEKTKDRELRREAIKTTAQNREDRLTTSTFNNIENRIEKDKTFQSNKDVIRRVNHFQKALTNPDGSIKDLTYLDSEEAARALNYILTLSQGSTARRSTEAIIPTGAEITLAQWRSWAKSSPEKIAVLKRFITPMYNTAQRIAEQSARENISKINEQKKSGALLPAFRNKPELLEEYLKDRISLYSAYLPESDKELLKEGRLGFSGEIEPKSQAKSSKDEKQPKSNYSGIRTIDGTPYWFKNGIQMRALTEDEKGKYGGNK